MRSVAFARAGNDKLVVALNRLRRMAMASGTLGAIGQPSFYRPASNEWVAVWDDYACPPSACRVMVRRTDLHIFVGIVLQPEIFHERWEWHDIPITMLTMHTEATALSMAYGIDLDRRLWARETNGGAA